MKNTKPTDDSVRRLLDQIHQRLDAMEDLAAWSVLAEQRFKRGDRVEFSRSADRKHISKGRKGGVRKGKVVKVDGVAVSVLLDGYARPQSYHHAFFNLVRGPKQF